MDDNTKSISENFTLTMTYNFEISRFGTFNSISLALTSTYRLCCLTCTRLSKWEVIYGNNLHTLYPNTLWSMEEKIWFGQVISDGRTDRRTDHLKAPAKRSPKIFFYIHQSLGLNIIIVIIWLFTCHGQQY